MGYNAAEQPFVLDVVLQSIDSAFVLERQFSALLRIVEGSYNDLRVYVRVYGCVSANEKTREIFWIAESPMALIFRCRRADTTLWLCEPR